MEGEGRSCVLYQMVMLPVTLSDPNHPNLWIWSCHSYLWNGWHCSI